MADGQLDIANGGTLDVDTLNIGSGANSGVVNIAAGGTLNVNGNTTNIDSSGMAVLNISGAFNEAGDLNIGTTSGGTGTVNVLGPSGDGNITGDINMAANGSIGFLNVNGGTLDAANITDGTGNSTLVLDGGTLTIGGGTAGSITVDNLGSVSKVIP